MGQLNAAIKEVGLALRRPEALTVRWRDRSTVENPPTGLVFPVFVISATLGLAGYGLTMGLHEGGASMLTHAAKAPFAAGLAWVVALPALYIVNTTLGSKLDFSTTVLAALATVSYGALAMLASVPVSWFFSLAGGTALWVRLPVNLAVFAGVGLCMLDVFMRVMKALEPQRSRAYAFFWLTLVAVIGLELFTLVQLF